MFTINYGVLYSSTRNSGRYPKQGQLPSSNWLIYQLEGIVLPEKLHKRGLPLMVEGIALYNQGFRKPVFLSPDK